jgi:hypothetical protein
MPREQWVVTLIKDSRRVARLIEQTRLDDEDIAELAEVERREVEKARAFRLDVPSGRSG